MKLRRSEFIPTLNLDKPGHDGYMIFIKSVRRKCWPVYRLQPNGRLKIVRNLRQSAYLGQISDENWVFRVRLVFDGEDFDVLMQWFKLYLVGYKIEDGTWLLLNGEYASKVLTGVTASFPVFDQDGNLVEPKIVSLGTSYSSLLRSCLSLDKKKKMITVKDKLKELNLKLNREALIKAVQYLRNKPFQLKESSQHVITLLQMICEPVRIEPIAQHVSRNFLADDSSTCPLSDELLELEQSWTRGSKTITSWTRRARYRPFWLKGRKLKLKRVLQIFPNIRALTEHEMENGCQ